MLKSKPAIYSTAVFALLTVAFVLWQSNFDPAAKEGHHRVEAKELLRIREQMLLLITECHIPDLTQKHLERCLEVLTRELTAVYKFAPDTSPDAYAAAEDEIKGGQFTFTDEGIDRLLPQSLAHRPIARAQEIVPSATAPTV